MQKLLYIDKVKVNALQFQNKVLTICKILKINPNWLMFVMYIETAGTFSPSIKNPFGTATGLIQFTESTAKFLGTTTAKLKLMSNVQQLDYVYKYLSTYAPSIKSVSDTYLAVFYPLALFRPDSYEFPKWVVEGNPLFDINKDKKLTKEEFKTFVNTKYNKALLVQGITTQSPKKEFDLFDTLLVIGATTFLYKNRKKIFRF